MNLNVTFPGNLAQVDTAADLRGIPSASVFNGILFIVKSVTGMFAYNPASAAVDDGTTVIKPADKTTLQTGRWIKDYSGLASGPPGATGASNNSRASLTALKAAAVTDLTSLYDGSLWTWTTGNFTGQADNNNVVQSDNAALTVGAWVRQRATGVAYKGLGATYLPVSSKLASGEVSITDGFGITMASADGTTDCTAAVQTAVDALAAAGGGTLVYPRGFWRQDKVSRNFNDGRGVSIRGEGKRATRIKKLTKNSDPLFDWSAPVNVLETYSDFSDMWLEGYDADRLGDGLRLTRCARFNLNNLDIRSCNTAIRSIGSLVFNINGCTVQGNANGLLTTNATGTPSIYSNAINVISSTFALNTQWAFDLGGASGVHIIGSDIEGNGTASSTSTGAIIYRASDDDESGTAFFSIMSTWLEGNFGYGIVVEPGMGSMFGLTLNSVQLLAQDAGRCANIQSGQFSATSVRSVSPSDTWTMSAISETWVSSNVAIVNTTTPRPARTVLQHSGRYAGVDYAIGTDGGFGAVTIARGQPLYLRAANGTAEHSLAIDVFSGDPLLMPQAGHAAAIGDGTWNGAPMRLGNNYLWVDSFGKLRIKGGKPTSDGDGAVVGTQVP